MSNRLSLLNAAPLFLVLFIDSMGLGLLFPIINSIIMDPTSQFLTTSASVTLREFLYGFVLGVFMLCWFFGSTILGDLSDNVGRKKALLICLLGSFFGYALSGIAIMMHSLTLLIVGRIIAGFTAGSQPIAQAAIVDISTPENKARNIGYITLAISLGFVFGPMFGGFLSDNHIVRWFTFTTPMNFAALISLLNALLLWCYFAETHEKKGKIRLKLHRAVHLFISAFQHHKVGELSLVLLFMIIGWSNYFSFLPLYMFERYHFDALQSSLFLSVMGMGFSVGCGYLVGLLAKHFDLQRTTYLAFLAAAACVLITLLFQHQVVAWVTVFIMGVVMGVGYANIITLFSNQVDAEEQGWVMGITGSVMALCFAVVDVLTGMLARYGAATPMIAAIVGLVISSLVLIPLKLDKSNDSEWITNI